MMNLIQEQLIQWNVPYETLSVSIARAIDGFLPPEIPPHQLLVTAPVTIRGERVLLVFQADHLIVPSQLQTAVQSKNIDRQPWSIQAEPNARVTFLMPPLASLFDCKILVDKGVYAETHVAFGSGDENTLLRVNMADLQRLWGDATQPLSYAVSIAECAESAAHLLSLQNIFGLPVLSSTQAHDQIANLKKIPILAPMVSRILKLRSNPNAGTKDLTQVIAQSAELTAQVLHLANSPLNRLSTSVTSLDRAIFNLGFEVTLNFAVFSAIGKNFKLPAIGPLSLKNHWNFSLLLAGAMEKLNSQLPQEQRLEPGKGYLVGLLHNIGLLVMNHLYPEHYQLMNELAAFNRHCPLLVLEKLIFGFYHTQVGGWLMQSWNLPAEVVIANYFQNQPFNSFPTESEERTTVALLSVAISLLQEIQIANGYCGAIEPDLLQFLRLDDKDVMLLREQLRSELESIANLTVGWA